MRVSRVIIFTLVGILFYVEASKKKSFELTKLKDCFEEQKTRCGDLICEMSTDDLYYVVEQLESNILECVNK